MSRVRRAVLFILEWGDANDPEPPQDADPALEKAVEHLGPHAHWTAHAMTTRQELPLSGTLQALSSDMLSMHAQVMLEDQQ